MALASAGAAVVGDAADATPSTIVERFVAAFNAHDVDAMAALCTDDVQWLYVREDRIVTETSGLAALRESMREYFAGVSGARSELRDVRASGRFVTATERAIWQSKDRERSQCSVSVYELQDSRIHRVWYYPAHACD